jgi:hypothetical protein
MISEQAPMDFFPRRILHHGDIPGDVLSNHFAEFDTVAVKRSDNEFHIVEPVQRRQCNKRRYARNTEQSQHDSGSGLISAGLHPQRQRGNPVVE